MIAEKRALAQATRPAARLMRLALPLSAALHAALAGLMLWRPAPPGAPEFVPPIEVELVQQPAERKGAAQPAPPGAPQAAPARLPEQDKAALKSPVPPAQAAPLRPSAPSPEVNLGNGTQDLPELSARSDDILPPAPDSRFRNLPPRYPPDAARSRAEGTVQLMVRVTVLGVPSAVIVVQSSGHANLDAAARDAVLLWRFRPARSGGRAVPFDYLLNIHFSLT